MNDLYWSAVWKANNNLQFFSLFSFLLLLLEQLKYLQRAPETAGISSYTYYVVWYTSFNLLCKKSLEKPGLVGTRKV